MVHFVLFFHIFRFLKMRRTGFVFVWGEELWNVIFWVWWPTYKGVRSWVKFDFLIFNERLLCIGVANSKVIVSFFAQVKVDGLILLGLNDVFMQRSVFIRRLLSKVVFIIRMSSVIINQRARTENILMFCEIFVFGVLCKSRVNAVVLSVFSLLLLESVGNWGVELLELEIVGGHFEGLNRGFGVSDKFFIWLKVEFRQNIESCVIVRVWLLVVLHRVSRKVFSPEVLLFQVLRVNIKWFVFFHVLKKVIIRMIVELFFSWLQRSPQRVLLPLSCLLVLLWFLVEEELRISMDFLPISS